MRVRNSPNINALWCALIVEELRRLGILDVVVSPGSRNTPLVAALIRAEGLRITSVVDERAAGFFALGCAKAGRPAAVVTTSGTAVMNLLPAITEARHSGEPLIILSTDRPRELRDCGANQTIDQLGPLRPLLKWQHDLPAPDDRLPVRLVLTAVDQAVHTAMTGFPGPVQLNCAFREPLAPSEHAWDRSCLDDCEAWLSGGQPFVAEIPTRIGFVAEDLQKRIRAAERGLIVVGNTRGGAAVLPLAEALSWPVIAEPASGIRLGNNPATLIRHLPLFKDRPTPDLVLQFGSRLLSRKTEEWLESLDCLRILIDPANGRQNPGHAPLLRLRIPVAAAAEALADGLHDSAGNPSIEWLLRWQEKDRRITTVLDEVISGSPYLSEAFVARQVAATPWPVFAGNSLAVRHLDLFAEGNSPGGETAVNRGASGIDGLLATACGLAHGQDGPLVLLLGDLSLLHDLNSLVLARNSSRKVLIVIINNGGGGIFDQLPVARFPELMSPLCDASHDLEFRAVARGIGLPAWRCETTDEWEAAWKQAQTEHDSCLVEAICRRGNHTKMLKEIRSRLEDG